MTNHLFISLGTRSADILLQVKELLVETPFEKRFIAIDLNSTTACVTGHGIEVLCLQRLVRPGEGSGMLPRNSYEAFLAGYNQFLELIGPPEQIVSATVISAPGVGGTATGITVPVCAALKSLEINTIPYIIQPAVASGNVGGTQMRYFEQVLEQMRRKGIKTFIASEDWVYKTEAQLNMELGQAETAMYTQLAQAISEVFMFWATGPQKLSFIDPSDLREQVLNGDGYLKHAEAMVDLADPDVNGVISRAFDCILNHNLYRIDPNAKIAVVVPYLYGAWTPAHMLALNDCIKKYCGHDDYLQKVCRPTNTGPGRLALLLSTAAELNIRPLQEFPELDDQIYSPALETVSADNPHTASIRNVVAASRELGRIPGTSYVMRRSFPNLLTLISAALEGSPEAKWIFASGEPGRLADLEVYDKNQGKRTTLFEFQFGSSLVNELLKYGTGRQRDALNLESLVRLRRLMPGERFSLPWEVLIIQAIEQFLQKREVRLPRYRVNTFYSQVKFDFGDMHPDDLRRDPTWKEYRRNEKSGDYGGLGQAWRELVLVSLANIFAFESFSDLIEPVDTRTVKQKIEEGVRGALRRCGLGFLLQPKKPRAEPVSLSIVPRAEPAPSSPFVNGMPAGQLEQMTVDPSLPTQ